jgi:hypothetical protein
LDPQRFAVSAPEEFDVPSADLPALDPIARDYVSLAFGIERHVSGYIDGYFGPPAVKEAASAGEAPEPPVLRTRAEALLEAIETAGLPEERRGFLLAQARAMLVTCRKLTGGALAYDDEVRGLFDVEPVPTSEATFEAAIAELDALVPGEGPLPERMSAYRRDFEYPADRALMLIDLIVPEARGRTASFIELPEGEGVEFVLVADKPWSGYNWFLGNARSRVEINTDLPLRANALVPLICHEAYPGHHAEHALKETRLYRERGWGEFAIQLIHTPEAVIAEGIATLAETIVFPGEELSRWQAEVLYPAAGVASPVTPEEEARIAAAGRALRAVSANAARLLHTGQIGEEEAVAYTARYGVRDEQEARHSLRFITDPLWRAYVWCYHRGRDLLGGWLDAAGDDQAARLARFRTLLTEPVYPSLVATSGANEQRRPAPQ